MQFVEKTTKQNSRPIDNDKCHKVMIIRRMGHGTALISVTLSECDYNDWKRQLAASDVGIGFYLSVHF